MSKLVAESRLSIGARGVPNIGARESTFTNMALRAIVARVV